jgi:class 3 adenylate cyclase
MGVVWEAFDQVLRRPVALKLMTPEHIASADARRRFEREAMALAQVRNEHIVQIHDYGIDEGSPFIVMELLSGEDMDARLRRERRLSPAATLNLLRQIADGLAAAVAVGVVHRDLKPGNIFIVRNDAGESVKLLDFGMAWTLAAAMDETSPTSSRALLGTPAYMSPEQVRGVAPHHLGDLWSLAVVAYKALTGRLPFQRESLGELIISICTDDFPPPSSFVPGLAHGADHFFERALAKDRSQRFQSARELCEAFATLCQGVPRPVKVLVVDDEPDVQLLMKMQFRREIRDSAYHLLFAENGQAALDELRRNPDVDVVLADINMPIMDGLTLLERIPEVAPLARTVIVSAYDDMSNIRRAMNEGAFDFLVKPIAPDDLAATVKKTIRVVAEHRKMASSDEEIRVLRKLTNAALVERLGAVGPAAALASEAIHATVVFVDVFQFTAVTKERLPGEVVRLLNANFEVIVPELLSRGGVVDKFLGDAVMVVYDGEDHLGRALEACIAVNTQMGSIARRAGAGSPYAHGLSIGVATGSVVSGCVGSHACARLGYTVIGEAANEAAHLARVALAGEILVTAGVRDAAFGRFAFEEAGARPLSPRAKPAIVYKVLGGAEALPDVAEGSTIVERTARLLE